MCVCVLNVHAQRENLRSVFGLRALTSACVAFAHARMHGMRHPSDRVGRVDRTRYSRQTLVAQGAVCQFVTARCCFTVAMAIIVQCEVCMIAAVFTGRLTCTRALPSLVRHDVRALERVEWLEHTVRADCSTRTNLFAFFIGR